MKDKKQKKSDETKAYIYNGAINIFTRDGFEKTTIRALAKELDISLGNLYYHFKSKDDILIHYFKILDKETTEAVSDILKSKKSMKIKLQSIIEENLKLLKKNESITRELINTTSNLSHPLSPFGLELQNCQKGAINLFKKALADHARPGEYLDSVAFLYWFYYLGICLCWANDKSVGSKNSQKLYEITFPLTLKLIVITKLGVGKKLIILIASLLNKILIRWD